ncbi:MAG: hypothetical protein ACFB9M_19690 [Myxococcota bacterium]
MNEGPQRATLALARERSDQDAEVIDLVRLPPGTRPTPVAYLDYEEVSKCRVMECQHYQTCLTFAAEVRWRSFHCRQCPHHPDRNSSPTPENGRLIRLR